MKKLFSLTALFCLVIVFSNCQSKSGKLTATLENIPDSTVLNIIDMDNGIILAKIPVYNNRFEYDYSLESPKKVLITEEHPKYLIFQRSLWLENTSISLNGNYSYFINAKVKGSTLNKINDSFENLKRNFEIKLESLRSSEKYATSPLSRDSISREIDQTRKRHFEEKSKLYLANIQSEVAFDNLYHETFSFNSALSKNEIKNIFLLLPEKFQKSQQGLFIQKYISLPEVPKIGEKFIDCTLKTPEGKSDNISNHLGKYTIIEFWASDCGPCRAKHPEMRKMYRLYHSKGLNIISISGDTKIDAWVNAIKRDSIEWTNLSDLSGWNNEGFMLYGIRAIPQMLILDENGTIVDDKFDIQYLVHSPDLVFKNQKITITKR